MKKTILTVGILLLGCCFAVAQSQTPVNPERGQSGEAAANPPAAGNSISGADWLQGCLSQSSDGSFTLLDNSGHNIQLRGDTAKLNSFVGKQIQVRGRHDSGSSADAMSSDAGGSTGHFMVKGVQKLSDTCK